MSAAVSVLLAATLALAAVAKLRDPAPFRATLGVVLAGSGSGSSPFLASTPSHAPTALGLRVATAARLLPAVELVLALALVGGVAPHVVAACVLALMLVFTVALWRLEHPAATADRRARVESAGALVRCHCFGSGGDGDPALGRVRNLLLAVAAATLIVDPAGALWRIDAAELAGGVCVAVGLACVWQLVVALLAVRRVGLR